MTKALAWVVVSCAWVLSCDVMGHSCTAIGCMDGVFGTLKTADGSLAEGNYTVKLKAGAETHTCEFSIPEALPARGSLTEIDCGEGPDLFLAQDTECTETQSGGSVSQTCVPIPDRWHLELTLYATPDTLEVEVQRGDTVLLSESRTLTYKENFPNGKECGDACSQATADFVFD